MLQLSENIKLVINETMGRHMVAAIELAQGDTIVEETPLLVVPHWDAEHYKCSKCLQTSFIMCKKCQIFPLCMDCSEHDSFDCDFFCSRAPHVDKNLIVKHYSVYGLLKLLLLLENPNTSDEFTETIKNDNGTVREVDRLWHAENENNIITPLLESGVVELLENVKAKFERIDAKFLLKLMQFIDDNAFEVMNTNRNDESGESLKSIFKFGSKLPHNCVPNTILSFDDEYKLKIYASKIIKSGEVIYNSYVNPLMGTQQRQNHLLITRNIQCACERCLDPTELGTHLSTLKCQKCTDGLALCDIGKTDNWLCNKCYTIIEASAVESLVAEVAEQIALTNEHLAAYESIIEKYAPQLHPNHFLILDMKQNVAAYLCEATRNCIGDEDKRKTMLERRIELSNELLPILHTLIPGISRLYAVALFDALMPMMELAELQYKNTNIDKEVYAEQLKKTRHIAETALENLAYEPKNSPEGFFIECINLEIKRMDENLEKLNATT